jgi:hypothetical protein
MEMELPQQENLAFGEELEQSQKITNTGTECYVPKLLK